MKVVEFNVLVLAYMGDTIYEDYIRKHLILKGISNVGDLQRESVRYVSAKSQARFLSMLLERSILLEDEISILRRARNYKSNSHPKNCDIVTYKHATALEAVIGYLYLSDHLSRIDVIMNEILKEETEC